MNAITRRLPALAARRAFSAAARPSAYTGPKTFKEAWLSDSGAYPVMGTILFGLVFSTSVTLWATATFKDARITDSSRKSLFRGEMAHEYQHPVKPSHH